MKAYVPPALAALVTLALLMPAAHAVEQTYTLRNYEEMRGQTYMGAIDWHLRHRRSNNHTYVNWSGFGAQKIQGKWCDPEWMVTEYDLGILPRGTVKHAELQYTFYFRLETPPGKAVLSRVEHVPDKPGAEIGRVALPAQPKDKDYTVTFDVTDAVRAAGSHVAFQLRADDYGNDYVRVYCGGRDGPCAGNRRGRPMKPEHRPTLRILVDVDGPPPPLAPVYAGVGDDVRFGPPNAMAYSLAEKPAASKLAPQGVTDGRFVPDAEGRYVVKSEARGIVQYVTIEVRRVTKHHPRLEMSPAMVDYFRGMRERRMPAWLKLAHEADELSGKLPGAKPKPFVMGYAGWDYLQCMDSISLTYVVAGMPAHGEYGKALMETLTRASLPEASKDAGYCIRTFTVALALGYDRLYPVFNAEEKRRYVDEMNYMLAWYLQYGYQCYGPATGNYFGGFFRALYSVAYATYRDNPRGYILLDHARRLFQEYFYPYATEGYMRGGDNPEGRYADGCFSNWLRYLFTTQTAGGEKLPPDLTWPKALVYVRLHRTRPDGRTYYDAGDWRDDQPSYVETRSTAILSALLEGAREGAYAQEYTRLHIAPDFKQMSFGNYYFYHPERRGAAWDKEPLSYFGEGLNLVTMRSSWAPSAVWASFQGASEHVCDHQHWDAGHWEVYRDRDPLVIDSYSDEGGSGTHYHNCLLVDDKGEINRLYNPRQCNWEGGTMLAYEDGGPWVYSLGDFAKHYQYGNKPILKTHRRAFLYLRPNIFVIADHFEPAEKDVTVSSLVHFAGKPTITDNAVVAASGSSYAYMRAYASSPFTIEPCTGPYQDKAVAVQPKDASGTHTVVIVLAALGAGEKPPQLSLAPQGKNIVLTIGKDAPVRVELPADLRPGGSMTSAGATRELPTKVTFASPLSK